MEIREVVTQQDIEFCGRAILAFRTNLNAETFVAQALRMMQEGFRLIYIANENNTEATAIAGFRSYEMFRTGKIIYVDDLFTFPENRGKGYAGALLDHIAAIAKETNVKSVHLESGFALHPAHRLYLNKGFILACHSFAKIIN